MLPFEPSPARLGSLPSSPPARSSREEGLIRFRFVLRPVEEISPWQDISGNPTPLHWFGLTDGWYWIEAGEQEVFRFSEEALADLETQGYPSTLPYIDYQIARFWEDLLDLLHYSLVPLPEDIATLLSDKSAWTELQVHCDQAMSDGDNWHIWDAALRWWWSRQLSSGHAVLQYLWIWRVGDEVTLRWDGTKPQRIITTSPVYLWTAPEQGEITVSLSSFLEAVHDFNDQLMAQMAERVAGNAELEGDHTYRVALLENALAYPYEEDWETIRAALRTIASGPSSGDEGANSGRGGAL